MQNAQTPEVLWAQRSNSSDPAKNVLYITLSVPDVPPSSAKLDISPTSISFSGHSDTKKVDYHVELELYAEIDVENSKSHHTPRGVELVLRKKEMKAEYWPRLPKESKKVHFLKTDFDKWVDEDDQEALADDDYGNFGGMGDDGGLGGIDFSKLGAAGGMGESSGMEGMSAGADDEDEDDSEDMPDLEEDDKAAVTADSSTPDSKPVIEEVS